MRKHATAIITGLLIIVCIGVLVELFRANKPVQKEEQILVTLPVFADVVLRLSDHQVAPTVLITPGQSEHNFSLTPSQLESATKSPVVLYVGQELDTWIVDELRQVAPAMTGVTMDKNISLRASTEEGENYDPHYWLSFENATIITDTIAQTLISYYPNLDKQRVIDNATAYKEEIRLAYNQFKTTVLTKVASDQKSIITYHDAWGYFTQESGFKVVGTIQEFAGKEPSAKYIADLLRTIKNQNIKKIYIEPQLATESVKFLLQDMGVEVRVLDPLGGVEGRMTYLDLLTYNLSELVK